MCKCENEASDMNVCPNHGHCLLPAQWAVPPLHWGEQSFTLLHNLDIESQSHINLSMYLFDIKLHYSWIQNIKVCVCTIFLSPVQGQGCRWAGYTDQATPRRNEHNTATQCSMVTRLHVPTLHSSIAGLRELRSHKNVRVIVSASALGRAGDMGLGSKFIHVG